MRGGGPASRVRIPKPGIEERRPLSIPALREFRHLLTPTEAKVWQAVRHRQLGFKFRRQHPIDRFIVDFRLGDTYWLSCHPARARKLAWSSRSTATATARRIRWITTRPEPSCLRSEGTG